MLDSANYLIDGRRRQLEEQGTNLCLRPDMFGVGRAS